jgi:FkbM family methyltransferase
MVALTNERMLDVYNFEAWHRDPAVIVLDCGANIGMFTRMALDCGAQQVVCFEPSPRTADCLNMTFASDIASGRLTILKQAVWDKPETLRFSASSITNPGAHHVVSADRDADVIIEATTIDQIVRELSLSRLDFIKMDIEGAEVRALKGAAETLRRFRPLIAIGTEHTDDIACNNELVIRIVREIDPTYRVLCTEIHAEHSPSHGFMLVPYSLVFY